jgi:hypothetical protein
VTRLTKAGELHAEDKTLVAGRALKRRRESPAKKAPRKPGAAEIAKCRHLKNALRRFVWLHGTASACALRPR